MRLTSCAGTTGPRGGLPAAPRSGAMCPMGMKRSRTRRRLPPRPAKESKAYGAREREGRRRTVRGRRGRRGRGRASSRHGPLWPFRCCVPGLAVIALQMKSWNWLRSAATRGHVPQSLYLQLARRKAKQVNSRALALPGRAAGCLPFVPQWRGPAPAHSPQRRLLHSREPQSYGRNPPLALLRRYQQLQRRYHPRSRPRYSRRASGSDRGEPPCSRWHSSHAAEAPSADGLSSMSPPRLL
jgi:hypothetical protein